MSNTPTAYKTYNEMAGTAAASVSTFSNMSDAQLKYAISQLTAGATLSLGPPPTSNAGPSSYSYTPPPTTNARSRSTRSTTTAAAPAVLQLHPQLQPSLAPPKPLPPRQQQQGQLQLWPPTSTAATVNQNQNQTQNQAYSGVTVPAAPTIPPIIPTQRQAGYSTYASRLRTGASLLVQPTVFPFQTAPVTTTTNYGTTGYSYSTTATGSLHHPSYLPQALPPSHSYSTRTTAPALSSRPSRSSRRARGAVNYAEVGSDEDEDLDGDDARGTPGVDDADNDFATSRRRGAGRNAQSNTPQPQPQPAVAPGMGIADTDTDLHQSYLGLGPPPSRYIRQKIIKSTAAVDPNPRTSNADPPGSTNTNGFLGAGVMVGIDYGSCDAYKAAGEDESWSRYADPTPKDTTAAPATPQSKSTPKNTNTIPPPLLIPIRVEFETDSGLRIRDAFVWNLHESEPPAPAPITPYTFAAQFCLDLDIPLVPYAETIANQIRAQVEEARGEGWVGVWRSLGQSFSGEEEENVDLMKEMSEAEREAETDNIEMQVTVDSTPEASLVPSLRVLLSLDVQLSLSHHLLDHIEWDLFSPLTPEAFSLQLCSELGLGGEAVGLVATAVHEELRKHRRDVVEWGVLGSDFSVRKEGSGETGGMKDKTGLASGGRRDRDREGRYPRPLLSAYRDWSEAQEYHTRLEELSPEEMERREVEGERAARRLRREIGKWRRR